MTHSNSIQLTDNLMAFALCCIGQDAGIEDVPEARIFPTSVDDAFACIKSKKVLVACKNTDDIKNIPSGYLQGTVGEVSQRTRNLVSALLPVDVVDHIYDMKSKSKAKEKAKTSTKVIEPAKSVFQDDQLSFNFNCV